MKCQYDKKEVNVIKNRKCRKFFTVNSNSLSPGTCHEPRGYCASLVPSGDGLNHRVSCFSMLFFRLFYAVYSETSLSNSFAAELLYFSIMYGTAAFKSSSVGAKLYFFRRSSAAFLTFPPAVSRYST